MHKKLDMRKMNFFHSIWLYSCYEVWFCSVWSWKEGYHKETKIKPTIINNYTFKNMTKNYEIKSLIQRQSFLQFDISCPARLYDYDKKIKANKVFYSWNW